MAIQIQAAGDMRGPVVTAYFPGGFVISGERYLGSVLVGAHGVQPWPVTEVRAITTDTLEPVFAARPELLLVGCGVERVSLPERIRADLAGAGIKVDIMGTAAACRTHAILSGDMMPFMTALIAL